LMLPVCSLAIFCPHSEPVGGQFTAIGA
jgi:hypothetical protein